LQILLQKPLKVHNGVKKKKKKKEWSINNIIKKLIYFLFSKIEKNKNVIFLLYTFKNNKKEHDKNGKGNFFLKFSV
jgi:hypothetical protein